MKFYLEFDNERLNITDIFSFIFRTNPRSNTLLKEAIVNFNPDLVYIHNLWFKGQLGIFKILEKNKIKVAHKNNFDINVLIHYLFSIILINIRSVRCVD